MAIIFSDAFTEAGDTALTAHTPNTGTSWTAFITAGGGTPVAEVRSSTDAVRSSAAAGNKGMAYQANPSPTTADVDVQFTATVFDTLDNDSPIGMFARGTDSSNFYFCLIYNAGANPDVAICKMVAGTPSSLVTGDTGPVAGDIFKFEIRGSTLKLYKNAVEILSTTDTAISAAGAAGLLWGNILTSTDDIDNDHNIDDFTVTEVSSGTTIDPSAGKVIFVGQLPSTKGISKASPSVNSLLFKGFNPETRKVTSNLPSVGKIILKGYTPVTFGISKASPSVNLLLLKSGLPVANIVKSAIPVENKLLFKGYTPDVYLEKLKSPYLNNLNYVGFQPQAFTKKNKFPSKGLFSFVGNNTTISPIVWTSSSSPSNTWSAVSSPANSWSIVSSPSNTWTGA